jgi:hypothetical protein
MANRRVCTSPLLGRALVRLASSSHAPRAGPAPATAAPDVAPASSIGSPALPPPLSSLALSPASLVLGIESSCDDTGVAVVRGDGTVLGQALVTQVSREKGQKKKRRPPRRSAC